MRGGATLELKVKFDAVVDGSGVVEEMKINVPDSTTIDELKKIVASHERC